MFAHRCGSNHIHDFEGVAAMAEQIVAKFYVYVHSRLSTGEPFYVGKGHRYRAYSQWNRNPHWHHIVAKDGGRYVSFIAENMDEEFAALAEIEAIDAYRRRGAKLVNMTTGGDGISGLRHSDESRAKMSKAHKGVKLSESHRRNSAAARIGRPVSQETREKQSKSHQGQKPTAAAIKATVDMRRGRPLSEEHRKNISLASRGKPAPNRSKPSVMKGKKFSEESRKKMSLAHRGVPLSEDHRRSLRASTTAYWARRKEL
jgi:hypothetical protein